eukprot:TRINITY_DN6257_c0_g2_i1.p1 TRINITY_DN6257_c0_g2~~TRINITY_DN6257_c0_g2_i1.p1  ORF type:complete len:777 (+),score=173.35 TRINITY_DN6257_c0_g2_i1:152-2482(+)
MTFTPEVAGHDAIGAAVVQLQEGGRGAEAAADEETRTTTDFDGPPKTTTRIDLDAPPQTPLLRCSDGPRSTERVVQAALRDVLYAEMPRLLKQACHGEMKKVVESIMTDHARGAHSPALAKLGRGADATLHACKAGCCNGASRYLAEEEHILRGLLEHASPWSIPEELDDSERQKGGCWLPEAGSLQCQQQEGSPAVDLRTREALAVLLKKYSAQEAELAKLQCMLHGEGSALQPHAIFLGDAHTAGNTGNGHHDVDCVSEAFVLNGNGGGEVEAPNLHSSSTAAMTGSRADEPAAYQGGGSVTLATEVLGGGSNQKNAKRSVAGSVFESVRQSSFSSAMAGGRREDPSPRKMFVDVEHLKEKMRKEVLRRETQGLFTFYKDTGACQYLAKNKWFETITLVVICFNAVWMAIDTDYNKADSVWQAALPFIIGENFFCVYFSLELIVRFSAYKKTVLVCHDGWFLFDFIILFLMVLEVWIVPVITSSTSNPAHRLSNTSVLRLLRLLRLCRMVRMLRGLPELMLLVKGMVAAMRSVMYVMLLLIVVTYVYAIGLVQMSDRYDFATTYFPDVPKAMYSLTIYAIFLDNLAEFCDAVLEESVGVLLVLCSFVILACLTVLNMLVGILCAVVEAVSKTEKEELETQKLCRDMKEIIGSLPNKESFDFIAQEDLIDILSQPQAVQTLYSANIDPTTLVEFSDLLFHPDGVPIELPFDEFMALLLDIRGSNSATVRDIMNLWKRINPRLVATACGVKELLRISGGGGTIGGMPSMIRPRFSP